MVHQSEAVNLSTESLSTSSESFSKRLTNMDLELVLSSLAQTTRRQILHLVSVRPRSLSELAEALHRTVPCILGHVDFLQAAHLVISRKQGRRRIVRSRFKKINLVFG